MAQTLLQKTSIALLAIVSALLLALSLPLTTHAASGEAVYSSGSINKYLTVFLNYGDDVAYPITDPAVTGDPGRYLGVLLKSFNVEVRYYADIYVDEGLGWKQVSNGATVPKGAKIKFVDLGRDNTHIYWNGTGNAHDTPYGYWESGAVMPPAADVPYAGPADNSAPTPAQVAASQCLSGDLMWTRVLKNGTQIDAYIPFSVNPPNVTFNDTSDVGTLANCAPDATSYTCDVVNTGAISVAVGYEQTEGKFYYRYNSSLYTVPQFKGITANNPYCTGNNHALREGSPNSAWFSAPDYVQNIEARTIAFALTAFDPSEPPTNINPDPPIVTWSAGNDNLVDVAQNFTLSARDPEGDDVEFAYDVDMDGTIDTTWIPTGGLGSEVPYPTQLTWSTSGTKQFHVYARDEVGGVSGPTLAEIEIVEPIVDLHFSDNSASISILESVLETTGTPPQLIWTATGVNSDSCQVVGDSPTYPNAHTINNAGETGTAYVLKTLDAETYTYTLSCTAGNSNTTYYSSVTLEVMPDTPPPDPSLNLNATSPIPFDSPSTVTWSTSDAQNCEFSAQTQTNAGIIAGGSTGSSLSTSNLTGDIVIVMTCTGAVGTNSVTEQTTIYVTPSAGAATAIITALPSQVLKGKTTDVTWNASGVTGACTLTNDYNADTVTSTNFSGDTDYGVETTVAITETIMYTITCPTASGDVTADVTIRPYIPGFIEE